LTLELATSVDARRGPAGLFTLSTAPAAVVRVLVSIDTDGPARRVAFVAAETAAAGGACGLTMLGRSTSCAATAAIFRVVLDHHAIGATHGLAIATGQRGVTGVASDVAGVPVHTVLLRVARQPVQVRGKAALARG